MPHVVTSGCVDHKYQECVAVCPVDAFREGPNFLVIDPDECIDCDLCVPECPEEAIFHEEEVPDNQIPFIDLNIKYAKIWPMIDQPKEPLLDGSKEIIEINSN